MGNRNVILIVLDTLRDDFSKEIDGVLKKYGFTKLPNVVSPSPWTLPSHASMFTGLYPISHGAHATKKVKIPDIKLRGHRLITQDLKEFGYTNYLFTANDYVRPFFGFRGFHHVTSVPSVPIIQDKDEDREKHERYRGKNAMETFRNLVRAREFGLLAKYGLREFSRKMRPLLKTYHYVVHRWPLNKGIGKFVKYLKDESFEEPFFLFVNLMEMHEPYALNDRGTWRMLANPMIDERIIKTWRERYPLHARYLARRMDSVMKVLKSKGLLENSLILITSDHGQLIGEDGKIGHGVFLRDELLRVPLWINRGGEVPDGFLSLVKLRKIILDYALGKDIKMSDYYRPYVYAESYGLSFPFRITPENEEYVKEVDAYRVVVYCCDGKAIFNVKKWEMEKIEGMDEGRSKELVMRFLDTGS